jgi:hypothetical protein
VRADIDPVAIANGVVTIILSLLMSLVQLGVGVGAAYSSDVAAVFEAALDRMPAHTPVTVAAPGDRPDSPDDSDGLTAVVG